MGCDIHIVIQRQDEQGVWREVVYQDALRGGRDEQRRVLPGIPVAPEGFDERNYPLFGVLAGVRDGDMTPISSPRGLPEGFDLDAVSPQHEYLDDDPRWLGDHLFSWLTLDELLAYPWDEAFSSAHFGWRLSWHKDVLPWLETLAAGRPLRLVFGFDN